MSNAVLDWIFGGLFSSKTEQTNATKFLNEWTEDLDSLKEMYSTGSDYVSDLSSYINDLGSEYDSFQEQFSPYVDQLLEIADSDSANRSELAQQFMDLAEADYQGSANRAVADAAAQSGIARESLVKDLNRRGTVSGARLENELRKSYLDEARTRTLASTQAQQSEKERAATMAATGVELFDPTDSITAATGIQTAGNDLLTARSDLATTQAGLQTNLAQSYGNTVTEQLADVAGTYQGLATAKKIAKEEGGSSSKKTTIYTPTYSSLLGKYV